MGEIRLASRLFPKQFTVWIEKWVVFLRPSLEAWLVLHSSLRLYRELGQSPGRSPRGPGAGEP